MKITKLDYSSRPWRLVDSQGLEVDTLQKIGHPTLGLTTFSGPVAGNTKKECLAEALALLETLLNRR